MNFRADPPPPPLPADLFYFSFQRPVAASKRSVPASVPPDGVAELAVCRAATAISSAVNNHLSDKPLDLMGGGQKRLQGPDV